jgi:hypothetical protein
LGDFFATHPVTLLQDQDKKVSLEKVSTNQIHFEVRRRWERMGTESAEKVGSVFVLL